MANWRRNVDVLETENGPLYVYDEIDQFPIPPCSTSRKCLDDVLGTMRMFHNSICYVGSEEYYNTYGKVILETLIRLRGSLYNKGELEVAADIAEHLLGEEYYQTKNTMLEYFGLTVNGRKDQIK